MKNAKFAYAHYMVLSIVKLYLLVPLLPVVQILLTTVEMKLVEKKRNNVSVIVETIYLLKSPKLIDSK